MAGNSNPPELTKKPKKGMILLFSLPFTPSFKLFLHTSARRMLAVTSQRDMASFSKELLLITLPAVSDNSVMRTHSLTLMPLRYSVSRGW